MPALISVSSFPPDETFGPRTIHLVPGTYVVTGTVPGLPAVTETVTVKLGADNTVTLKFEEPKPEVVKPLPPPPPPVVHTRSPVPRYLLIGAGAAAIAGIGFHTLAYLERGKLQNAAGINDPNAFNDHRDTFEAERTLAITCYGLAAVAAGVGFYLHSRDEHAPAPTAALVPGGAVVGIEVRR